VKAKLNNQAHFGCTSGSVMPLSPVSARVVEATEDWRIVAL
jgi:hypothetical protein